MFGSSWKMLLVAVATADVMATSGVACDDASSDHLSLLQTRSSLVLGTAVTEDKRGPLREKGNEVRKRTEYGILDGSNNMQIIDRGVGPFEEHGILTSVKFYAGRAGNRGLKFRIWRPVAGGDQFIGETEEIEVPTIDVVQEHVFTKPVPFLKGDYIGFAHGEMDFVGTGMGNIPYDQSNFPGPGGGNGSVDVKNTAGVPGANGQRCIANVCALQNGWTRSPRQYSYKVYYTPLTSAACLAAEMCDAECPEDLASDQAEAIGDPHAATNTGCGLSQFMKNGKDKLSSTSAMPCYEGVPHAICGNMIDSNESVLNWRWPNLKFDVHQANISTFSDLLCSVFLLRTLGNDLFAVTLWG